LGGSGGGIHPKFVRFGDRDNFAIPREQNFNRLAEPDGTAESNRLGSLQGNGLSRGVDKVRRAPPACEGVPNVVGERGEVRDDRRRQLFEQWQDLEADAHPEKAPVPIRRIFRERDPVTLQVSEDVAFPRANEGSDEHTVDRREHAESASRRPVQQPDEHGLGAIVRVVRCGDSGGPGGMSGIEERRSPRIAGARLQIAAWRHVHPRTREGHPEAFGERRRAVELG